MLGLENVGPYMQAKQAQKLSDWTLVELDNEGKLVQEEMTRKFQVRVLYFHHGGLSLMCHCSFCHCVVPRRCWLFPRIDLRNLHKHMESLLKSGLILLLRFLRNCCRFSGKYRLPCGIMPSSSRIPFSHAHAFHNPANWNMVDGMQPVVERILTDRFWQAGISTGSRDDFYARITSSKSTLEGFASSVRGKVRAVREACYSMLFSMSRLGELFYGFKGLPGPLAEALFVDSPHLSSHQFSVLLNISRCLIDDCPVECRAHFLPPMLSTLFTNIDRKITTEWEFLEQQKGGGQDGDLTTEMKSESVLRQLTYSAVIMVASLFDPQRDGKNPWKQRLSQSCKHPTLTETQFEDPEGNDPDPNAVQPTSSRSNSIRHFVLSSPEIFEPVMLFCTHALRMRDTRCCSIVTRVIRSILQDFAPNPDTEDTATTRTIREFICSDVLKACITSVHEPYFVDMQKDFAQLIASIWIFYGNCSETPGAIFLSLPGITAEKIAQTEAQLRRCTTARQQRAWVLEFLEPLRGISIAEQGNFLASREDRRRARSALQERYTTNEMDSVEQHQRVDINDGPDLDGVADLFGG